MKTHTKSRAAAVRRRRAIPPLNSLPPEGTTPRLSPMIARETADEVIALGLQRGWFTDLYHRALMIGWPTFLALNLTFYLAMNIVFATLYLLQPGAINNAAPGSFADAFFFSVETIATIGYGVMAPATLYANLVMTVESSVGILFAALTTGLVFARFSRPTARAIFSRVAVVGPYNGRPTLSLRIANRRRNQVLAADVTLTLVRDELTSEGDQIRRFYDMQLKRAHTPIFALTFTVMHEIDEASPLRDMTPDMLAEINAELVVTASGIDEILVERVHARTSYLPHEILWGHRFVDIFGWTEDGRRVIDYSRFHDTVSLAPPPAVS
jgi:inward rectifier potassium channel